MNTRGWLFLGSHSPWLTYPYADTTSSSSERHSRENPSPRSPASLHSTEIALFCFSPRGLPKTECTEVTFCQVLGGRHAPFEDIPSPRTAFLEKNRCSKTFIHLKNFKSGRSLPSISLNQSRSWEPYSVPTYNYVWDKLFVGMLIYL